MNFNDTTHLNMTNIDNQKVKIGLDNHVCKDPVYFCTSHKVYLSKEDTKKKGCFHKMTPDMISYRKCNWLMEASEYESKIARQTENIQRLKDSKKKYLD